MRKYIYIIYTLCLFVSGVQAQVLWSDDFDSYPVGTFSMGQGGWGVYASTSEARVDSELDRGNVLVLGWLTTDQHGSLAVIQEGLDDLWKTRTPGNEVMKLEYDFYTEDFSLVSRDFRVSTTISISDFTNQTNYAAQMNIVSVVNTNESYIENNIYSGWPKPRVTYNHNWIKIEFYLDYNNNTNETYVFAYIPSLNVMEWRILPGQIGIEWIRIGLSSQPQSSSYFGAMAKYDNFKLSAIPTRPFYLSTSEFVSSTFTIFPNPVTDVVTITNSENMGVEQIEVFDSSGKKVQSQNFNKENEVQLNLGDFASGMYLLHIKTNEGTTVKKVVKK